MWWRPALVSRGVVNCHFACSEASSAHNNAHYFQIMKGFELYYRFVLLRNIKIKKTNVYRLQLTTIRPDIEAL